MIDYKNRSIKLKTFEIQLFIVWTANVRTMVSGIMNDLKPKPVRDKDR